VGPVAPRRAAEMAATLACGPTAAVSHRSAAALWEIAPEGPRGTPVEVQVVRHARRRPGVRVHRTAGRHPDEVVRLDGIPVTSPARTLFDLAGSGHSRMVERAFARALLRDVTTRDRVAAIRARYAGRSGTALLRKLLGSGRPARTRSEAEHRFLRLVRSARLPAPQVNVRLGPYEVDFYWPDRHLAVEIDGFTFHASRTAFERDRERDANLATRGIRVLRFTWRQLTDTRDVVLVRLAQTLGPQ